MNPRVIGVAGPFKGTIFEVPEGGVSIGRDPSNQLWVNDPALSRHHCQLTRANGQFIVQDLESRNGTLVNGVPVQQQELQHQDKISVGDSVLVFAIEGAALSLDSSPVELTETADLNGVALVLRQEDALYLQPQKVAAGLPAEARIARDLNSLLKIATGIGAIRDAESLQWQILGMIFDVVPADRGAIVLCDTPEEVRSTGGWDRVRGPGHSVKVSRTVVGRVLRERVGVVVNDVSGDDVLRDVHSLAEFRVRSLLCVPLVGPDKVLGAIYLDSRSPSEHFDQNHLQMMTAIAGIASLAFENVRRLEALQQENRLLRSEINLEHNMVGESRVMREVYELIRRVAPTDSTVLIQGESGTGKELVARAVHRNSPRAERSFVAINCAAITETLLESELLGHEKGAFTGATAQKKGKIEIADGGTLFLDEVSELAPGLQAKLLRVLQEREFERVGGTRPVKVDIRLIAASNRNLPEAVGAGTFRKDLYYRLNVVALTMPPLRERREDITLLADYFVAKASRKCRTRIKALSPEARVCLMNYDWPGNVRELENALERALVMGTADVILPDDLPESVVESGLRVGSFATKFHGAIKDSKKQVIMEALQQANGKYTEAAKLLGLHPNSLLRLIRRLDLKAATKALADEA
ncbi:MAG: sigma-54-dependent Fis family transcriptional regulator [Acidobacteria bacterium]|nr:MAG: sigma-54-dependent Fis family transcriptional regulator [Acidobacteriota bacterium]